MEVTLEQKTNKLLDKLVNDVIEGCALQCDEIVTRHAKSSDKAAQHGAFVGSAKYTHKAVGAEECAAAVRELKW